MEGEKKGGAMGETGKILIVDDDESFVDSNRDLLEAYGYEVHTARNGAEGLELARKVRPNVIVLDVMMATDTEGFEVARKIPESPELQNTKVLLVTGLTKAMNLPGGVTPDKTWLPVERVLEKPIPPGRLIAEVEKLLKEKRRA
jgi:CheY-like chemotaxis protein